jgi:transcriptional regulator with XRE-family HTH domain
MELEQAFGRALRFHRIRAGLPQEGFSLVSSRTYMSTLERGLKSPTLIKIQEIASVIDVHPLSILTSCYLLKDASITLDELFSRIRLEVEATGIGTHESGEFQ